VQKCEILAAAYITWLCCDQKLNISLYFALQITDTTNHNTLSQSVIKESFNDWSKMKFANSFGGKENMECGLIRIVKINDWEQKPVPVPLIQVDVEASVVHAVAQVQITQVFKNLEEQPIEAIYFFPVDPNGAVTHFEAEIEGRKIKVTKL